jgi:hypothetical protein
MQVTDRKAATRRSHGDPGPVIGAAGIKPADVSRLIPGSPTAVHGSDRAMPRNREEDAVPAHLKFINVLLVPLNAALLSAKALKNRVTGEPGPTQTVSPTEVYQALKANARTRECRCVSYSLYRTYINAYDPARSAPAIAVSQQDWELYFQPNTAFDCAVKRFLDEFGTQAGHDFTLILYPEANALKRIEILSPEVNRPAMLWVDGKGVHPD